MPRTPKNAPYYNDWDRLDEYVPHEPDVTPEQLKQYKQNLYGTVLGMQVWGVDGFAIRSTKDLDFVAGGNPARYRYVPNDELWVESSMSPPDALCTSVHEGIETVLMTRGISYGDAHSLSNVFEWNLRQEMLAEKVKHPATHVEAIAMADVWLREKIEMVKSRMRPRMAFPPGEILSIKNQLQTSGYAYTTRVDAEQGKWKIGMTADSPFGVIKIAAIATIENFSRHPFLSELSLEQKNLLSKYDKMDVIKFVPA